jgi:hypothetical protein
MKHEWPYQICSQFHASPIVINLPSLRMTLRHWKGSVPLLFDCSLTNDLVGNCFNDKINVFRISSRVVMGGSFCFRFFHREGAELCYVSDYNGSALSLNAPNIVFGF